MVLPKPSSIRMKRKGERDKVGEGEPLIKIEKKVEESRDEIHCIQVSLNPNTAKI
jgi:hypothetical protein